MVLGKSINKPMTKLVYNHVRFPIRWLMSKSTNNLTILLIRDTIWDSIDDSVIINVKIWK
jgi:hypothetical protein